MPEHRPGTPSQYVVLESFLWRDFESAEEWAAWTASRKLGKSASASCGMFEQAMALQKSLRLLEAANNGGKDNSSATARLNRMVRDLDIRPIVEAGGNVSLSAEADIGSQTPIHRLLIVALSAMADGAWHRFKLCRDPTCHASFYDASKSATKAWCSMERCGSRNKMRRLRQRRSA
jgi:predicted RNA-binding Zn ribbon-like protein